MSETYNQTEPVEPIKGTETTDITNKTETTEENESNEKIKEIQEYLDKLYKMPEKFFPENKGNESPEIESMGYTFKFLYKDSIRTIEIYKKSENNNTESDKLEIVLLSPNNVYLKFNGEVKDHFRPGGDTPGTIECNDVNEMFSKVYKFWKILEVSIPPIDKEKIYKEF